MRMWEKKSSVRKVPKFPSMFKTDKSNAEHKTDLREEHERYS